jgi:hypothetical protein
MKPCGDLTRAQPKLNPHRPELLRAQSKRDAPLTLAQRACKRCGKLPHRRLFGMARQRRTGLLQEPTQRLRAIKQIARDGTGRRASGASRGAARASASSTGNPSA